MDRRKFWCNAFDNAENWFSERITVADTRHCVLLFYNFIQKMFR